MNKKTCCGCFGAGCFLIVAAFAVGSYLGVNFLYSSGKSVAAKGLKESVRRLAEMAFDKADRDEIIAMGDKTAERVKSGEIGLVELFKEVTSQLESNMHVKTLLLAFARKAASGEFVLPAEMPGQEGLQALSENRDALRVVDRVIYGIMEKQVSVNQIASITAVLADHYSEKITSDDGQTETHSFTRLKENFSPEDVKKSLEIFMSICDESGVATPATDFNASVSVKKELLALFGRLGKKGAADDK